MTHIQQTGRKREAADSLPLYGRNQENLAHISALRLGTRGHREGQCAAGGGGGAAGTAKRSDRGGFVGQRGCWVNSHYGFL